MLCLLTLCYSQFLQTGYSVIPVLQYYNYSNTIRTHLFTFLTLTLTLYLVKCKSSVMFRKYEPSAPFQAAHVLCHTVFCMQPCFCFRMEQMM